MVRSIEKRKIHLIGTRTRDHPACSIVPQATTLPMPFSRWGLENCCLLGVTPCSLVAGYRRFCKKVTLVAHSAQCSTLTMEAARSSENCYHTTVTSHRTETFNNILLRNFFWTTIKQYLYCLFHMPFYQSVPEHRVSDVSSLHSERPYLL
jgi:hypothetical protein